MTVLITLTTAGLDAGPFDLYSNVDGYSVPFETGVSKAALLAGYTSTLVTNNTITVRVGSTGICTNYIDVPISGITTTTTSSSSTTTTTTTSGICCGDIFFPSSNFTDEDLTYNYLDCETGQILSITVYYGTSGETVYGRIACGIEAFDFTQARSTSLESCGDTTMTYTLYSPTSSLQLGDVLFEDAACVLPFQHGVVFMKELLTGQVWQVGGNGVLTAVTTCSS